MRNILTAGLVLAAACVAGAAPQGPDWTPRLLDAGEAAEGFFPLFNGQDLDGWWISGENKEAFQVTDGILGTTGEGGGGWMYTDKTYANFLLRLEFRSIDGIGNSGVGIRAPGEGNAAALGMEVQIIQPGWETDYQRCGALYHTVAPAADAAKPMGEWNTMEILCEGPRIRTVLNGEELYDIQVTDYAEERGWSKPIAGRPREGHIALQDHGDRVEFRRVRIKPLPGGLGWRPLFDGETLDGWEVVGDATWSVLDGGILNVNGAGMTTRSELRSVEEFGDFELRFSARAHSNPGGGGANSGVFFRGRGQDPWPRSHEAQIDNHAEVQFTGSIWDQVPASELRAMDDCWFLMHIAAKGPSIQVSVNGKTVVDFMTDRYDRFPRGFITLQGHDESSVVDFKNIEIRTTE